MSTRKTHHYCGKVVLLKDYNIIHREIITYSPFKAYLIGWIWRYVPDFTFKGRRYMIVDV